MMASMDEDVEKTSLADQDDVESGLSSSGQNKSTVIQVEAKRLIQIVKPLKNDLLDMLLPRMLSVILHLGFPEVVIIVVLGVIHQNMIGVFHQNMIGVKGMLLHHGTMWPRHLFQ